MKKLVIIFLFSIVVFCIIIIFFMYKSDIVSFQNILYDLVMGIILSALFYFIVDYYPQRRKRLAGYRLIQLPFSHTLASMNTILHTTASFYDSTSNIDNYVLRDWKNLLNRFDIVFTQFVLHVNSERNNNCKLKNSYYIPASFKYPTNLNEVIKSELKQMKKNLDLIFSYESYFVEDIKFYELLTKLKNSSLFEDYIINNYNFNYIGNTYEYMYQLQELYFALYKYKIHYYNNMPVIDSSLKALEYQEKYNSGEIIKEYFSFQERREAIVNITKRGIYYNRNGNEEILAKEIAHDFHAELKRNEKNFFDYDLIIIITNIFEFFIYLIKINFDRKKYYDKLVFFVINVKIYGLLFKTTKITRTRNFPLTLFFIPSSFNWFGKKINKEHPSINNIAIIRNEIDNQFNKKYKLNINI